MSGIFESIGIDSGIVIIILLILTIILLINVVSSNMRLSRLERKYKLFMRGGDAQSLEKVFVRKFAQIDRLRHFLSLPKLISRRIGFFWWFLWQCSVF